MKRGEKRFLSYVLTAVMILAVMPVFNFPMRAKAKTAGDFVYEVNVEGKITITGYKGQGGDIVIPTEIDKKPVVGVGDTAFERNNSIKSVTFKGNVENIGDYAFDSCTQIESVTFTGEVGNIDNFAFAHCLSLKSIIFEGNIDTIDVSAFYYCKDLTSVTFDENVGNIGECAFQSCDNLTSVTFEGNVGNICEEAFDGCDALTSVTFKGNVTSIDNSAFEHCNKLGNVILPQQTVIADNAFANTTKIYTYGFDSDTYTGQAIPFVVKVNGVEDSSIDYTVTYKDAKEVKDAGDYTAEFTMTNPAFGPIEIKHTVKPLDLKTCDLILREGQEIYDGEDYKKRIKKDILVCLDNTYNISSENYIVEFIKEGETEWDSNLEIIEAGKYEAKVKGNKKNTTGEEKIKFEIQQTSESFDVSLNGFKCTYDGEKHYIESSPVSSAKSGTTSFEYSFVEDADFVSDLSSLTLTEVDSKTIYVRATNPNYSSTATTHATLTIDPKTITITAASDTKACDGSALTKDSYTNTALADDDRIESVTITGSQTEPGSSENVPSEAVIKNRAGKDVTTCYKITYANGTLTVEDHVFDRKVATDTYLAEEADFTHAARYYYSCKCGETGTVKFEAGEPLPTYTIIFDANGGSVEPVSADTNAEYKLDSLPTPSYDGYNFLGWFTNETGGDEITTSTVYGANMTIYSHWEKKEEPKPAQGGTEKPETPTEPSVPETPSTPATPEKPETPSEPEIPETEDVKEETKSDYLDELYALLREAIAKGEEQTINWSVGDSLPYDVMKILEENPQITLVFNYTYMGEDFNVTIRGRDVQADPKVKWCGPLYLYSIYGGYKTDENGLKESGTYIVQAGDTLSALATKFNTTIKNLVALNNIKDENLIYIGQELKY